jgi:hypothetical protein
VAAAFVFVATMLVLFAIAMNSPSSVPHIDIHARDGIVIAVYRLPSFGAVAAMPVELSVMAQNNVPFHAISDHDVFEGRLIPPHPLPLDEKHRGEYVSFLGTVSATSPDDAIPV